MTYKTPCPTDIPKLPKATSIGSSLCPPRLEPPTHPRHDSGICLSQGEPRVFGVFLIASPRRIPQWPLTPVPDAAPSPPRALAESRPSRDNGGTNWAQVSSLILDPASSSVSKLTEYVRHLEEAPTKDKAYRKYASGVDRALSLFETALQEWADYISFLNRLLKVG